MYGNIEIINTRDTHAVNFHQVSTQMHRCLILWVFDADLQCSDITNFFSVVINCTSNHISLSTSLSSTSLSQFFNKQFKVLITLRR